MSKDAVGVGLLGAGVVGTGVATAIAEKRSHLADMIGCPVDLKRVLVRDAAKPRAAAVTKDLITTDVEDILSNPDVDVVVELMGGQDPALDYILRSISAGKHVVTANKEVMARHGPRILGMARKKGVQVLFEAAVAGGTPIIAPILRDLVANDVLTIHGIINGTTNFILTSMDQDGADFGDTLAEAQRLGYAEADPTNDVEGIDAAYKLAILASLGFPRSCQGYGRLSRRHNPADRPRLPVRPRAWLRNQAAGYRVHRSEKASRSGCIPRSSTRTP